MRTRFRVSLVCALILSAFAAVGVEGPVDDFFINSVSGMAPEQQVHAVVTKLKKLNPNFDGKDTHKIENGVVTELSFSTVRVTDISPLKALKWLKKLVIAPSMLNQKGALADLAPLKGLPLTWLWCHNNPINDLTPLRGMPLTILSFNGTQVSDLSPLNGMKLTSLSFSDTLVADLAPLENMPLSLLWCNNTKVTDLSPLRAMPLQELKCDFVADRDAAILRDIKSLARINDMPAAAFWKRVGPVMVRVSPSVPSIATQTPSPSQGTVPTILSPAATTKLSPAATAKAQTGQPFVSSIGMELLYIPPGEFLMGSTKEEQAGAAPRKTTIAQGFWLGRTEVTVGQWKQFVAATGYRTDAEKKGESQVYDSEKRTLVPRTGASWQEPMFGFPLKDTHPVCCVSWNDALAFCGWLTEQERKAGRLPAGMVVRLPTEAEWEYACRAGKQTKFWWGDSNEDGNNRLNWAGKDDGFEFVAPVDSYGARGRNGFGLADMLGNVMEWCLDEYDAKQAHEECYRGNPGARVLRGGSFYYPATAARCDRRYCSPPASSNNTHGFRVCVGVDLRGPETATTSTFPVAGRPAPQPLSPAATAKAQTGQPFVSSIGMELLYIPPGEFLMGSTKGEQAWAAQNGSSENVVRQEGEQPRKTMIKEGFWLGRTEVTVGQWKAFVMATGYKTDAEKKGYADHALQIGRPWGRVDGLSWRDPGFGSAPQDRDAVSCISWNDAVAFCEWLTEQERKAGRLALGQVVRLPTEAEWEYACRAGRQTKFWWGESQEDSKGRLNWSGKDDGFEFLAPVDSYGERGRNGFGLADMLGNVYEWCLDEFDEKQAHEECYKGNSGMRVLRGGSFLYGPAVDRCAFRHANPPDRSVSFYGFRVAVGVDVGATKPTTAQSAGQGDSLEIVSISPPLPAVFKIDDRGFAESVNVTIRYRLDSSDAGRIWAQATTKAKYSYTPSTVIEKGSGEIVRGFFLREPGIVEAVRVIMLDDRTKTQIKSVSLPIRAEWRMKN